jgi:hypothetical protein
MGSATHQGWLFSALKGGHIPQLHAVPIGSGVKIFCVFHCIFASECANHKN